MPLTEVAALSPDLAAIGTSIAVLVAAVAAMIGGIYKGLKDISRGGPATGTVQTALRIENSTLRLLTASNTELAEAISDLTAKAELIDRNSENLVETMKENRDGVRAMCEEQRRLRIALTDLHELLRSQRR